jgi:hypothetical protein
MSEAARVNGWRGFDGAGDRTPGGWLYTCDGLPRPMGCGAQVTVTRKWTRVGTKKSGWLVCYGFEPKLEFGDRALFDEPSQWEEDHDIVLTFCPNCAEIVRQQSQP